MSDNHLQSDKQSPAQRCGGVDLFPEDMPIGSMTLKMKSMDEQAWTYFYSQYKNRILSYQLTIANGDMPLAAENTQETLLRVVRHIKVFTCPQAFWSWLACLARCSAIDAARKRSNHLRILEMWAHFHESRHNCRESEHPFEYLEHFLETLSLDEAHILNLRYWHGMTVNEIASHFSITPKSIEYQMSQITRKARIHYKKTSNQI
jgi:RNA polymerase sigma-70 factor (ECF subfamily)